MQEQKYTCNKCGFDSPETGGYCPMCEEGYMLKVCECGTGKFAFECCEIDMEAVKKQEEMKAELLKETQKEIKEITEVELTQEEKEQKLFEEAAKESPVTE